MEIVEENVSFPNYNLKGLQQNVDTAPKHEGLKYHFFFFFFFFFKKI